MPDVYDAPIADAQFATFCGGNLGGEHETCLSVAEIPGMTGTFVVHDTKPEGAGQELRATAQELDAFALGWVRERGLQP
ncbi:DUF397 domain-containing protein [Streptomyces piniterrae]|uniref:DUF397 domain-containing protein n=1 Tax=Streptomyces piniterrae TaxID=2571125 RepID=A0A4U0MLA5_9ACTN|nr:DUF397 domain-containing protein [Streptomyces piniterrae]TJZ41460.1 DUF397 domain-containing protein [Streptomyces piniterrae]